MPYLKFQNYIVGDSRICGLQTCIDRITEGRGFTDILTAVLPYRGANIQTTLDNAITDLKHKDCDVVYFTAGVNELSTKTGRSKSNQRCIYLIK